MKCSAILSSASSLVMLLAATSLIACFRVPDNTADTGATGTDTLGDGDGDPTGDGDGDGDGDTGDGDGDGDSGDGDGDGDSGDGDGDGDGDSGDGDGDGCGNMPDSSECRADSECSSCNCYVIEFLGGRCGECNSDADCAMITGGGCTPHNPYGMGSSSCNMGEAGAHCESSDVCQMGLTCSPIFELFGIFEINTCGECVEDIDCQMGSVCAPVVDFQAFGGLNTCIDQSSLPQDSLCNLMGSGDLVCQSGICSAVDVMGLAEIGACGECNNDADCMGMCLPGEFDLNTGTLTGSTCI